MFSRRRFLALATLVATRPISVLASDLPHCKYEEGEVNDWHYSGLYLTAHGKKKFAFPVTKKQKVGFTLAIEHLSNNDKQNIASANYIEPVREATFSLILHDNGFDFPQGVFNIIIVVDGKKISETANVDWPDRILDRVYLDSNKNAQTLKAFKGGKNAEVYLVTENNSWVYREEISLIGFSKTLKLGSASDDKYSAELYASKCEQCFITTAVCTTVGLDDDCFELRTLRDFRDQYLALMPGGQEVIESYYKVAPKIVNAVNEMKDSRKIWLQVYFRWILPSVFMAKIGLHHLARKRYTSMMKTLSNNYLR